MHVYIKTTDVRGHGEVVDVDNGVEEDVVVGDVVLYDPDDALPIAGESDLFLLDEDDIQDFISLADDEEDGEEWDEIYDDEIYDEDDSELDDDEDDEFEQAYLMVEDEEDDE
jgi:hypothetical protein